MSKRLHPIRKITRRLDTALWWKEGKPTGEPEKIVARHVKPLLDALEDAHHHCSDTAECKRLLAAWKEPLK